MLVPQNKLILIATLVLVPLALLPALDPALIPATLALLLAFVLIVAVDAFRVYGKTNDIGAAFPPLFRFTQDRDATLDLVLTRTALQLRRLRIGLDLPGELGGVLDTYVTDLPEAAPRVHVALPCRPLRRGNYTVQNVYLEEHSPFGWWAFQGMAKAETQVRVYPNLRHDYRAMAALFLNRAAFGIHPQRQVGKGREFEKLREYVPGDDFGDIHWKATARRGRPITKDFQVEKTQEVYVVIDASRLSAREIPGKDGAAPAPAPVIERFIAAALTLGMAAERQGDLFGLVAFGDRVRRFVPAKGGKGHFAACREALYTLTASDVTPDFEEVCSFIRLRLRKRALLIFLTNLDDPVLAERFAHDVGLLSRHHLVVVNMVKPAGVNPIFAGPAIADTRDIYDRLAGHLRHRDLDELARVLKRRNVALSLIEHEDLIVKLVAQYMNLKQRQLL